MKKNMIWSLFFTKHSFRKRREAARATFFDELGIRYEYAEDTEYDTTFYPPEMRIHVEAHFTLQNAFLLFSISLPSEFLDYRILENPSEKQKYGCIFP